MEQCVSRRSVECIATYDLSLGGGSGFVSCIQHETRFEASLAKTFQ